MQKFKDLFYDDLSVARGNYFLTLLYAFLITIILLIGFVVSDTHILYGMFIVLIGIVLLRLFKINLLSFKKLTMSQVIYIIGGALLIYGLDHLYLHFHDVPTNEQELDRELQHTPLYMSIVTIAIIPAIVEEIVFRGMIIRVVFRKHLFIGLVVSSLVFASLHESDTWIGYLPYLYSGVIFGLIYLKTKRLEVVILIHFINNLSSLLILIWG
ncbi:MULTISPECIES: CPBP family intramembrane glutamic endopeptidase [Staphylococcus]|uniref:CAAX amino terminal protease family protein n=3 Tax=Staphylococcus aureus TaxID=1280 RepID=A0AAX2MQ55_STAAU|nr:MULTISPECIES: type II CAAX endopeptidase family protein [Staphylococcus]HDH6202060.1 CPBP family intramembrane metalloprotease [Staphylococcus aureus LTCF-15-62]HDH6210547.1 CPBP family intramembrane metalloprotease [Staphylococcus aureus LTCF-14-59]HDH6282641.1 CPBP family intramembrane metalloprotease [Staphylococcus aureus LTCF-3-23]HDH6494079.1 CPBP family intramembrane metalloprotease [Staphylococcus aureus MRSA-Lux-7]HDK8313918.1 CPBP family intramembrane metalloprotease [Staphylococc